MSKCAWTQSVDNSAGPRFLSVCKTLMFRLDFSSCSSSRSCFVRLLFQCSMLTAMFTGSSRCTAKSLSSRSGFSRSGFQPLKTYSLGLKSASCKQLANLSWRWTLRQKSLICRSNWAALGGQSEGLNFNPMPRTLDCRSVSCTDVKLWISEFHGIKSSSGLLAILNNHFPLGERLSTLQGRNLFLGPFFEDDRGWLECFTNFDLDLLPSRYAGRLWCCLPLRLPLPGFLPTRETLRFPSGEFVVAIAWRTSFRTMSLIVSSPLAKTVGPKKLYNYSSLSAAH